METKDSTKKIIEQGIADGLAIFDELFGEAIEEAQELLEEFEKAVREDCLNSQENLSE